VGALTSMAQRVALLDADARVCGLLARGLQDDGADVGLSLGLDSTTPDRSSPPSG